MKFTQQRAFEKHLADSGLKHLCPVYFLIGKDSFVRQSVLKKLQSYFKIQADISSFEGGDLSPGAIMNELNAGGLFSQCRLVIIHDAEKLDKAVMTTLESYFENPNPAVCLVISGASLNHNSNFYRKGEKTGVVFEAVEEKPWEKEQSTQAWIAEIVGHAGKKIEPGACQKLVKLLGSEQGNLQSEIQKLICYIGDRQEISLSDIATITAATTIDTGWQLGEAIFRRDVANAMRIAKAQLLDGVALIALCRQIRSQFQTEFQICSILAKGGTGNDVSKQFPYLKGTILERHINQSQAYGMQRFKKGLLTLDHTELQAKNSAAEPELLLELAIIKLTE